MKTLSAPVTGAAWMLSHPPFYFTLGKNQLSTYNSPRIAEYNLGGSLTDKKLSILIPDGENEHVLWVVRSLAHAGQVSIHILSSKRWTPVRFSRHPRLYTFKPSGTDHAARLAALTEISGRVHIDVILPVSEEGVLFAAAERDALAQLAALPPLPSIESLETARNKWSLNQLGRQLGLPVPDSALVTLDPAFDRQVATLTYPVLLKPVRSTDGQGIRRFDAPDALQKFLRYQNPETFKGQFLLQPVVPGADLGLSVLCQDGQIAALTMQRGILSAAHRFGPLMALELIRQDEILEIGQRLFAALNWSGVAHVDLRQDHRDGSLKVLEINARYWGSLLGSLVGGVNFPYLACLLAQGESFPVPEYRLCKYAHTTTAIKEGLLWCLGKNTLTGCRFQETGLKFFLADPLPEIIKRLPGQLGT